MLTALLESGFMISATWPSRTERTGRLRDTGSNALASSIVLVCRGRPNDAPLATRREFLTKLKEELPEALRKRNLSIGMRHDLRVISDSPPVLRVSSVSWRMAG